MIMAVAFNDDGAHLLTMCISGPVELRDARAEGLLLLRTLQAFHGPADYDGDYYLCCAGGLAVAVGGGVSATRGVTDVTPSIEERRARVWAVGGVDGREEEVTLELPVIASACAVRSDGSQIAIGGADGVVRLFGGEDFVLSALRSSGLMVNGAH